jgi:hypothetical protein
MGLLRRAGPTIGAMGDFHPASQGLKVACRRASEYCDQQGERLEVVGLRFALESWIREGATVGSTGDPASRVPRNQEDVQELWGRNFGVSVIGVSHLEELDETLRLWRSILDGLEDGKRSAGQPDREESLRRKERVEDLARGVREVLGEWYNATWESPPPGFVNARKLVEDSGEQEPQSAPGEELEESAKSSRL